MRIRLANVCDRSAAAARVDSGPGGMAERTKATVLKTVSDLRVRVHQGPCLRPRFAPVHPSPAAVATGSHPYHPADVPLEDPDVHDSETILT